MAKRFDKLVQSFADIFPLLYLFPWFGFVDKDVTCSDKRLDMSQEKIKLVVRCMRFVGLPKCCKIKTIIGFFRYCIVTVFF